MDLFARSWLHTGVGSPSETCTNSSKQDPTEAPRSLFEDLLRTWNTALQERTLNPQDFEYGPVWGLGFRV